MSSYNTRYSKTPKVLERLNSYKKGLGLKSKPTDFAELIYRLIFRNELTYYIDRETESVKGRQSSGKARSVEDTYRIVKTYYPKATYNQVARLFYELVSKNILHSSYCTTVNKWVHNPFSVHMDSNKIRHSIGNLNINFNKMPTQVRKGPIPSLEGIHEIPSNKKAKILREHPNLYVKGGVKDLAELIHRIMIVREATFTNEACTQPQTDPQKLRSIEDLYMVSKTYFPKISYIKLEERIKGLYNDKGDGYLSHSFCSTVKREVHSAGRVGMGIDWVRKHLKDNLEFKAK